MRKMFINIVLVAFMVLMGHQSLWAAGEDSYRVGAGDVLEILVIGHSDLTTTDIVSPDGSISFPYVDTVKVEGMTLKEIGTLLAQDLSPKYIQFPEIIVRLREPKSQKFFVYGEVKNPGVYHLEKNMTALKAISMAGGYSAFANKKVVKILHQKAGTAAYDTTILNLGDIVNNSSKNNDVFIQNEDIVVVVEK